MTIDQSIKEIETQDSQNRYKFMIFLNRLSRLVTPFNIVQKSLQRWKIFYTILYRVTKRLSRMKKLINFHHQFFKRYPTPSAINVKNHFHLSDLDSQLWLRRLKKRRWICGPKRAARATIIPKKDFFWLKCGCFGTIYKIYCVL